MTRLTPAAAFVLMLVLVPADTSAQTGQGRLAGLVTDAQRAVLPGVTVAAASPSLIGEQSTITQADGRYLFPALPPGVYTLTFTLASFQTVRREGIALPLATTITVDAEMTLSSVQETVVVTGASPIVDVSTTKVGVNLKGDQLVGVPNSTDIWGVLSESPGVRMQGFDVGGSHKSQQSGFEVFGIQNQIRVISDGIDHTESNAGTGFYEDYFANEEVSVSALGSDVEMNGGGAAIVTTIKSGGNTFKGLFNVAYEPGRWVGDNVTPELAAYGYTGNPTLLFWETHADLGGPIRKDRLWFFYAFNHFTIDKIVSGVPQSLGTDLGIFDNHTVKSTWRPSQANTIVGYFQQGRKQKPRRGISVLISPESTGDQDTYSRMYKGEWQGVVSDRTFLDVIAGRFTLDTKWTVHTNAVQHPPTFALDTGAVTGAQFPSGSGNHRNKPQLKAQLTHYRPDLMGSHDFKFGYETMYDWYRVGANGATGAIQYRTIDGAPVRVRFIDVGAPGDFGTTWGPSANIDLHHTGYAQDRWSPSDRLTITAGVRVDYQEVSYTSSTRRPVITEPVFPSVSTIDGRDLVRTTNAAARLGFTYDLTGKRHTVLKGFYGRYYNNLADSFSTANPGQGNIAEYNFNDINGNGRYDGPQELGTLRFRVGGANATVNPDLRPPFVEEFSGSLEHQFRGESSVRLTLVRKSMRDYVPYWYSPYIPAWVGHLTVPTDVTVTGPSGQETYHVFDIPDSLTGQSDAHFDNIPDSNMRYTTIELALRGRLTSRFFVYGSFDRQWRDELRSADTTNWGATDPLSTDPLGVGFFINPNPAVPNRQQTTMWHLQGFARYELPYDIGVAGNLRYQSGFPYSRVVPDGELPNLSPAPFFVENLDHHRSDNVTLLNLRVDKAFIVGKTTLTALFDLYNARNAHPVTNFNLLNDDFGHVIAVLDPRVAQIGLRLTF